MFFISIFFYRSAAFTTSGDDEVYRTSIETWGSWFNWAKAYYFGYSGRIIIHTLLIVITNLPVWVFRLCSAAMVTLSFYAIYRIANADKNQVSFRRILVAMLVCTAMFYGIAGLGGIIRWASGALNYLYPVCAFLFVLIPFTMVINGKKIKLIWKIISIISVFLCANMEQASAIIAVLGILTALYLLWSKTCNIKDGVFLLILWLINICVFIFSYTAPGVGERYSQELLRCCGYSMFTSSQKIVLGIQVFTLYLFSFRGLLIWLFPTIGCALVFYKNGEKKNLILCAVNIVLCGLQNILIRKVFDIQFIHPYNLGYNVWISFSIFLIMLSGYLYIQVLKAVNDKYWYGFLFLGAVIAAIVPAFSPTLFVSAARTMYITYIILILISVKIWTIGICECTGDIKSEYKGLTNKVYITFSILGTVMLVSWFVKEYHEVTLIDGNLYTPTQEYTLSNLQIDDNGVITGEIEVDDFEYVTDNWCTGLTSGYDFDISVGIINEEDKQIKTYQTVLNPEYPVMKEFENGVVQFTGYYGIPKENKKDDEKYVLVIKDHDGGKYYQYIDPCIS